MHHTIVALEGIHVPIPDFEIPPPHTATQIVHHFTTTKEELIQRVHDATIIVNTTRKITAEILDPALTPNLQLIAQLATGTDNIDLEACRKRGIKVSNTPGCNIDSVAEHAVGLYFATRRSFPLLNTRTRVGEWKEKTSLTPYMRDGDDVPPLTCREEICGIVGFGNLGKRIAELVKGLGMKILISDRKSRDVDVKSGSPIAPADVAELPSIIDLDNPPRIRFSVVLKHATVLMVVCPLTPETRNLISTAELNQMRKSAVLINVARGGIVDENALANALKQKVIAGAAMDVFAREPSGLEDSPLLTLPEDVHFIATPHVAWFSELTMTNMRKMIKENVEGFIGGEQKRIVV